jgi:hypothetical protein
MTHNTIPVTVITDLGNHRRIDLIDWVATHLAGIPQIEDRRPHTGSVVTAILDSRRDANLDPYLFDSEEDLEAALIAALDDPGVYGHEMSPWDIARRIGDDATGAQGEALARTFAKLGLAERTRGGRWAIAPLLNYTWLDHIRQINDRGVVWHFDWEYELFATPVNADGWSIATWFDDDLDATSIVPVHIGTTFDTRHWIDRPQYAIPGDCFASPAHWFDPNGAPRGLWVDAFTMDTVHDDEAGIHAPWSEPHGILYREVTTPFGTCTRPDDEPATPAHLYASLTDETRGGNGTILIDSSDQIIWESDGSWAARQPGVQRAYVI